MNKHLFKPLKPSNHASTIKQLQINDIRCHYNFSPQLFT